MLEVGAFAAKGLHAIAKPQDYGALGHYRAVLTTGTIAAGMAANGELVQMRWVDATRFCVITHVAVLEFRNITTAFAARPLPVQPSYGFTAWSADENAWRSSFCGTTHNCNFALRQWRASLFSTGFRLATTAALVHG